jgi:catechol 2,3-dioxygenase-like lactoylglutathione lyase family enzyme
MSRIDHLVVAAASLDQGIAWCRTTFGFEPASGGQHPLMGTHNRVFRIDTPRFPRAYFEIIAIDPGAIDPGRVRWFDLDDAAMRASLAQGPRLVHFVASTDDAPAALERLRALGIDRGELLAAERPTPSGLLRWKISVRGDGARLFDGALPTLIEWGPLHATDNLPASGVALESLELSHPRAPELQAAFDAIGLQHVALRTGPAQLAAELASAAGRVRITS